MKLSKRPAHAFACSSLPAWILSLAPALLAQEILQNPERFWRQESDYAGSRSCEPCHAEIYRRQAASNHAASLRSWREVPQFLPRLPFEVIDRSSAANLRLHTNETGSLELIATRGSDVARFTPDWAFGSGAKGITLVGQAGGAFVESRLSWYASLMGFDFTTGATKYSPVNAAESLGRKLTLQEAGECFGCHTTGYNRQKQAPTGEEMGIRCERCHGPGLEHGRAAKGGSAAAAKIFHPGKLGAFAQAQMCGICHGNPPEDNNLDAINFIERTPHTARFPSQRLVLSRCFNESPQGLKCTACHDPHGNVSANRAGFDKSCLVCHGAGAACPVGRVNCASCHMPVERVMQRSQFTDHWIRVVRARAN
jgi:hypothetical protein